MIVLDASQIDFAYAHGIPTGTRLIIRDSYFHKTRGFGCLQVKKPLCAALICGRRRVMEAMPRPIAVLSGFTGKDFVSVDIGGLIREYLYLINRPGFLQVNRHPGVDRK